MKAEVQAATEFLVRLLRKGNSSIEENLNKFQDHLSHLLVKKYENHWFPEAPTRGQAYRCIRVNENDRHDPILEVASKMSGINYNDLSLPIELTIWVDPLEVTCRFGEHEGSFCVIACFKEGENPNDSSHSKQSSPVTNKRSNQQPEELLLTKCFRAKNLTNSPGVPVSTNSGFTNRFVSNSNPEFYTNQLNYSPYHFTNSPPHQSALHNTPSSLNNYILIHSNTRKSRLNQSQMILSRINN